MVATHTHSEPIPCFFVPAACHRRAELGRGVGNKKRDGKVGWRSEG